MRRLCRPLSGEQGDLEAGLGHEPGFHAVPRADVADRRPVAPPGHQRLAHGQGRLHVTGRAPPVTRAKVRAEPCRNKITHPSLRGCRCALAPGDP